MRAGLNREKELHRVSAVERPSGKGAGDENFPVGSWLLPARLRVHIASFYAYARAIDDIADDPDLEPQEKIGRLDRFARGGGGNRQRRPRTAEGARNPPQPRGDRGHAPALRGPDTRVQAGRHQIALRRLGRSDGLLQFFGGPRGSLPGGPSRSAGQRVPRRPTPSATRCRCSIIFRTVRMTTRP